MDGYPFCELYIICSRDGWLSILWTLHYLQKRWMAIHFVNFTLSAEKKMSIHFANFTLSAKEIDGYPFGELYIICRRDGWLSIWRTLHNLQKRLMNIHLPVDSMFNGLCALACLFFTALLFLSWIKMTKIIAIYVFN